MIRYCAFADEASKNIPEQIEAMKRNGISMLEIRGVDGTNISQITAEKAKEVRGLLDAAGLSVWSMGSPIGKISLADDFEPHVEEFKRILEYADILGASKIRLFSFFPIEGETNEQTCERAIERLAKLCELTPDGIVLCHENEKKIFGETAENCLAVHKALPKVRAVFDPANFVQCGVDTKYAWDMLRERTEYLHIKDALADGTVVPAGEGIGNLPFIISDYIACGGKLMTLEPHLMDFIGLGALENGKNIYLGKRYKDNASAFSAAAKSLFDIINAIK